MAKEIIMPALGMAQETGTLLTWHKREGDTVNKGDLIALAEGAVEMVSFWAGCWMRSNRSRHQTIWPVGNGTALDFGAQAMGFDFNPAADRIRVVSADGRNWRVHPDTGALVQQDTDLRYADGDAAHGHRAALAAAGYSYNKTNDKITTNYAIDAARGTLVRQGSLEGVQPVVSPNTGLLATVGAMGTGAVDDAAFDIADVGNTALAALRSGGRTRLHLVDLASGRASLIGSIDRGGPLWGMAIVP